MISEHPISGLLSQKSGPTSQNPRLSALARFQLFFDWLSKRKLLSNHVRIAVAGCVKDREAVMKSIRQAKEEAERAAGVQIRCVYVSVGGEHISSRVSKGVVAVSRADSQVSEEDVDRAINAASAISIPQNREILHVIPRNFILDEQKGIKDPVGMNGVRLEVDALIIEGSTPFIKNLIKCVSEAGLEIEGLVLASLARRAYFSLFSVKKATSFSGGWA